MSETRRLLLTGARGQLGRAVQESLVDSAEWEVVAAVRGPATGTREIAIDLLRPETLSTIVHEAQPDAILHAAAMTNVDECERNPTAAATANGRATKALATAAAETGSKFVYVSTDYVFDGLRGQYREEDTPNPIQSYGASKLMGEHGTLDVLPDATIARTSVVYGPHKNNFVRWVASELAGNRRVRIVTDQVVTPTLTSDLAAQCLALVHSARGGIYHTAGATTLSRFEMAQQIAAAFGLDQGLIDPVRSSDLSWVANRPLNSSLVTEKIAALKSPLSFHESLAELAARFNPEGKNS